jgi:hypothetical protein
MKQLMLVIGPVLFLIAQAILPEGSAQSVIRSGIIQDNLFAWDLGHQLILLAFAFLILWLTEVHTVARHGSEWASTLGLLFTALALCADYGVGILQLHSSNLVKLDSARWAQPIMAFMAQDQGLLLFAFLPTLGFVPGFALLAVGYFRHTRSAVAGLLLALAGVLIAVAGVMQVKLLFVMGAVALLAFTVVFVRAPAVTAGGSARFDGVAAGR